MIKIKKIFLLSLAITFFISNSDALIKDSLFATLKNKAITRSDIVSEIKIILILTGKGYSEEQKKQLEETAIKSVIKRNIKQIEIAKYRSLTYNPADLNSELMRYASNLNMDMDTFQNTFIANGIDFSMVEDQVKTELLWNSLIFELYKNRLSINNYEIEEQLKKIQEKKFFEEFLVSEIIIKIPKKDELESTLIDLKKKIKIEGFENVALNLSISETAIKGGDLGWISENIITDNFRLKIINTPIGEVSEPIFLTEGILFFKVRDKKKSEEIIDIENAKEKLVRAEKTKILRMHGLSHYENLKRTITINYH